MISIGEWLLWAFIAPVTAFVAPGPEVTSTTPIFCDARIAIGDESRTGFLSANYVTEDMIF